MRVVVGILLALGFATAMYFATLTETAVQCEVCVRFEGRRECRLAGGFDEDTAVQGAVTNACAMLANGVTQSLRCGAIPPESIACKP